MDAISAIDNLNNMMMEGSTTRIQILLRFGNLSEQVIVDKRADPYAFDTIKERARLMVERNSPDSSIESVCLYRHDQYEQTMVPLIDNIDQLENGCIVQVIPVNQDWEVTGMPHVLKDEQYLTPTFCDFCGVFIYGVWKQGKHCTECKGNFHHRCIGESQNKCNPSILAKYRESMLLGLVTPLSEDLPVIPSPEAFTGIPHTLRKQTFYKPTVCCLDKKLLYGIYNQGYQCRDCRVAVHTKCRSKLKNNCIIPSNSIVSTPSRPTLSSIPGDPTPSKSVQFTDYRTQSIPSTPGYPGTPGTPGNQWEQTGTFPISPQVFATIADYTPLFRLPGQIPVQRRNPKKVEGWMIHHLRTEPNRRLRHYWVLENHAITMYHEYHGGNSTRFHKRIKLEEIAAVAPYDGPPTIPNNPRHVFEIITTTGIVYCVGENLSQNNSHGGGRMMTRANSVRPTNTTPKWLNALKEAIQPPHTKHEPIMEQPQFADIYQLLDGFVLGGGMFGIVYKAVHRSSGREVAVKIIENRGSAEPADVKMLERLNHPGIIRLECMFSTKERMFVVTEVMDGDMLQMITTQANGRLCERTTRFLLVQILTALKYLHEQGIAHCDLKPENVLLSDLAIEFPQAKLCDFGYAKFIPEAQFRTTLVGTPAYLPPEVPLQKGYNHSIDLWSMGVVAYVTLGGIFPFKADEDIVQTLQSPQTLYPKDPWSEIDPLAIDLIGKLLRIEMKERLPINGCLSHPFLKGPQLHADLRNLERSLNCPRYLTTSSDDCIYAAALEQMNLNAMELNSTNTTKL